MEIPGLLSKGFRKQGIDHKLSLIIIFSHCVAKSCHASGRILFFVLSNRILSSFSNMAIYGSLSLTYHSWQETSLNDKIAQKLQILLLILLLYCFFLQHKVLGNLKPVAIRFTLMHVYVGCVNFNTEFTYFPRMK